MQVLITGTFEIKGRGVIVCLETIVPYGIGEPHPVQVLVDAQTTHNTTAYKEWLNHKLPAKPLKNDCFLLDNITKAQVPVGSILEFLEPL